MKILNNKKESVPIADVQNRVEHVLKSALSNGIEDMEAFIIELANSLGVHYMEIINEISTYLASRKENIKRYNGEEILQSGQLFELLCCRISGMKILKESMDGKTLIELTVTENFTRSLIKMIIDHYNFMKIFPPGKIRDLKEFREEEYFSSPFRFMIRGQLVQGIFLVLDAQFVGQGQIDEIPFAWIDELKYVYKDIPDTFEAQFESLELYDENLFSWDDNLRYVHTEESHTFQKTLDRLRNKDQEPLDKLLGKLKQYILDQMIKDSGFDPIDPTDYFIIERLEEFFHILILRTRQDMSNRDPRGWYKESCFYAANGKIEGLCIIGDMLMMYTPSIPEYLGDLTALKVLWLKDLPYINHSRIFAGDVSKFQALEELFFVRVISPWGDLPEGIENLPNLRVLKIQRGGIADLSKLLSSKSLEEAYLDINSIQEIRKIESENTTLKILSLNHNYIMKIHDSISNLKKLKELYLRGNQFKTIPESVMNLQFLKILNIDDNPSLHIESSLLKDFRKNHALKKHTQDNVKNIMTRKDKNYYTASIMRDQVIESTGLSKEEVEQQIHKIRFGKFMSDEMAFLILTKKLRIYPYPDNPDYFLRKHIRKSLERWRMLEEDDM